VKIVQEVLNLGDSGYITKNNAGEHIVKAIKTIVNGEQYFSNDIQSELLKVVLGQKTRNSETPKNYVFESLTEREKNVLTLVIIEFSTI
jgi:two-component system invasion response regulator UvrY